MNKRLKTVLLAAAGAALIGPTAQAFTYTTGDLILGVHATGGTGAGSSLAVDLGPANQFTSTGTVGLGGLGNAVGSLGTDLTALFGANWATRSDLFFGVAADTGSFAPGAFGLPIKTLIDTAPETTFGTRATPWNTGSATAQGTVTTKTETVGNNLTGAATGTSPFAVHQGVVSTSWAAAMPGGSASTATTSFGYFNGGIEANLGNGVASTAVDLFEMQPSGTPGPGTFLGSFRLDSSGNVLFNAVPEPSVYGVVAGAGLLVLSLRTQLRRKVS